MIRKNKYKEEYHFSQKDEFFYERIKELPRMSFIVFYIPFNNKNQRQRRKQQQRYSRVHLCISGCQQP